MDKNKEKVLVTGASGYIALHCIKELLDNQYVVKASLRDLNKEIEVREALGISLEDKSLEFCKLDLLNDVGWDEATNNCDYLMHIASPCFIEEPKNENILIEPAVNGTMRALKSAQNSSIKKVVLTSSIGSMAYGHQKEICDPNDWTNTSKEVGSYIKSKTLAEKAAWDYVNNHPNISFKMTTIHPGMVFGPLLSNKKDGISSVIIKKMINGDFPALPNIYFTVVDVRDVAKLHVKSLKLSESNQKRIIATSKDSISFISISEKLRALGFVKSPVKLIPNQVINSLSLFNKGMKTTAAMVKRGCYGADISETLKIYDWSPIPFDQTIKDMTNSLKNFSTKQN